MADLQKSIEESIKSMELLKIQNPNGWVVESENHICVGIENGLNNTSFTVKCSTADTKVVIYDTKEDAEKYGFDYYLIDGNNKPIYMKATKAVDFFQREIENTRNILVLIGNNPYSKL